MTVRLYYAPTRKWVFGFYKRGSIRVVTVSHCLTRICTISAAPYFTVTKDENNIVMSRLSNVCRGKGSTDESAYSFYGDETLEHSTPTHTSIEPGFVPSGSAALADLVASCIAFITPTSLSFSTNFFTSAR